MQANEILGRDNELSHLDAFLGSRDRALRSLVLEGEAGVGKSTLWAAGVAKAEQREFCVLTSRPAEAERELPHVVLADLLEDVIDEVLPTLSGPRRHALESALLVDRAPGFVLDPRALGVAVRTGLHLLAEQRPLVLAVDDIQWVDSSSASVLAFALRRLRDEPICLLLARRLSDRGTMSDLDSTLDSGAVERLRVGPLSIGATHALVQRQLGRQLARPALHRLYEISGGNPFYALELARGLGSGEAAEDPLVPFPVPETLERLVGRRLRGLGGETREALLLTAAHGRPSPALLSAAGVSSNAFEPAFAAHVVERSERAVRFTHPLLASVLYQGASEDERRGAHSRLAAILDDPVERARHVALASDTPDEVTAATLEDGAMQARSRGTIIAAAELAEHARRLTPSGAHEHQCRRTIAAARAHLEAGDASRARALSFELLKAATVGARAEALVLLSDIESAGEQIERAIELRREALDAAEGAPALQGEIHEWLASFVTAVEGPGSARRHAVAALELAETLDDDTRRARALSVLANVRFWEGDPDAMRLVEQAHLATADADPWARRKTSLSVVFAAVWSYQLDRARTLLESLDRDWSERDELAKTQVLWWLALTELRSGRFRLAAEYAEEATDIRRQYAIEQSGEEENDWLTALIAAHTGELERARAECDLSETEPVARLENCAVLGLVELWSGRPEEAAARFAAANADTRALGINEPALIWWCADHAEALLALGKFDEAAVLVDAWEADATRLGREVLLAQAKRCHGLMAAAQGDVDRAIAELERAVAQHEAGGDPFGCARALLVLGVFRRKAGQKRAARQTIDAALKRFEELGAAGWAAKARAELGTIGGRTPTEGLTPAEGRIAALVAEGRTNREVAAELFVTEQTVATALTRVYRKLGVRSRTELARLQTQNSEAAKT